jgi:amidase
MFFDVALERAQFLDDYLASQGKPMGSLHGMPVNIKDSFNLKGTASKIGYVSFISHGPANLSTSYSAPEQSSTSRPTSPKP